MAIPRISAYSLASVQTSFTNKVTWTINAKRAVLLVHDMQNYFVDFYRRDQEPMQSLLRHIETLTTLCRQHNIPVVYTAQPPNQKPHDRALLTDFWGPGLTGEGNVTAIVDELKPQLTDIQYVKWRYSAFQRTPLMADMLDQGRDQLIICGVYAHIGILSTALEAFMRDVQVFVVADAVADFSPEEHSMALNYIAGRCGKVEKLADVVTTLSAAASSSLTLESMTRDLAKILMVPASDIHASDNLLDLGLDSIRLMTLVEQWRAQGATVDFVELAEAATLGDWWAIIEAKTAVEPSYA
ncbi:MAG: isochorismatase family protein [Cellvibrionaceae bacterium]|nr:isochorismatase family protein [Cellvibrionaceae bacterium]